MKVLIVNPKTEEQGKPQLYMSLLYLATAVEKAGHKVKVFDYQIEDCSDNVKKFSGESDCIALTVMSDQIKSAVELSDIAKSMNPDIKVVWGGHHPSLFPVQTVEDKSVDFVVKGEGETAIVELLEHLEGKRKKVDVSGLAYMTSSGAKINTERSPIDINVFSPPSWHLMKMEKYIGEFSIAGRNFGRYIPVHSGRGCPHRCSFCINTTLKYRRWRPLSAENIVNEIKLLKKTYGVSFFKFVDENFFLDRERIKKFCSMLIDQKIQIKWHATCRANYFRKSWMDDNLLRLVKKSGCSVIGMGIESGSVRILELLKKDITVDDAVNAVRRCAEHDIIPVCSFMTGLPTEKKEDIRKTLNLINELKKMNGNTVVIGPQIFRPYPGCDLYELIKETIVEPTSLRGWMNAKMISGFYTPDRLKWIENPKYLITMSFFMQLAESSSSSFIIRLFKLPFKKSARFRMNHSLLGFPVEKAIFETLKKLYMKAI
ncbi:MAG: B12-binding domain-containing radical SAM protein [Candidatus Aenigmarchaeota archaeon]|nr:B12-binding domain-containing radical SAM protein [Candidatus Aenigmarchaeota archaeon]